MIVVSDAGKYLVHIISISSCDGLTTKIFVRLLKAFSFPNHKDFQAETQLKADGHEYFEELPGPPSLKKQNKTKQKRAYCFFREMTLPFMESEFALISALVSASRIHYLR